MYDASQAIHKQNAQLSTEDHHIEPTGKTCSAASYDRLMRTCKFCLRAPPSELGTQEAPRHRWRATLCTAPSLTKTYDELSALPNVIESQRLCRTKSALESNEWRELNFNACNEHVYTNAHDYHGIRI